MAMLAEPKRRQKLSSDPRNKAWINDDSKFGEKLMKKMGWQQGKGLGKNEDGNTSCITTSVKNNTLGVGCSESHEDNWINHQDDFNLLLSSLNEDHEVHDEATKSGHKPQNLQAKSKKAKKRVHYGKFTRGKDLSACSTTQMNCIMGVRGTTKDDVGDNGDDSYDGCDSRTGLGFGSANQDYSATGQDCSSGVPTFASSYSIEEYFAEKLNCRYREKASKTEAESSGGIDFNSSESIADEADPELLNTEDGIKELDHSKRTKSKKKKVKSLKCPKVSCNNADLSILCDSTDVGKTSQTGCDSLNENLVVKSSKKKRKKSREVVEDGGSKMKSKKRIKKH